MIPNICPRDCPDRCPDPNCHSYCAKYAAFRDEIDQRKAKWKQDTVIARYISCSISTNKQEKAKKDKSFKTQGYKRRRNVK
jgi:hypothetical protein